jgi:hypothetical protein
MKDSFVLLFNLTPFKMIYLMSALSNGFSLEADLSQIKDFIYNPPRCFGARIPFCFEDVAKEHDMRYEEGMTELSYMQEKYFILTPEV